MNHERPKMVRLEVRILQIFHMREALPFSLFHASTLTQSVSKISRYNSNSLKQKDLRIQRPGTVSIV